MALLATTLTTEVILLIVGLFLFDGGIIRKFSATGIFVLGLQLAYSSQKYVSDLTASPTNVSLFFTPEVQRAWVIMFALLTLTTLAWTFISIARIAKFVSKGNKLTMTEMLEELV